MKIKNTERFKTVPYMIFPSSKSKNMSSRKTCRWVSKLKCMSSRCFEMRLRH